MPLQLQNFITNAEKLDPQNMKQLGLDAKSSWLSRKIHRKIF